MDNHHKQVSAKKKDISNGESLILYQFSCKRVPVNIRPVVYCTAVSESTNSKEWDHLWNAFKATNVAAEQRVIMEALGCTRNADILKVLIHTLLGAPPI